MDSTRKIGGVVNTTLVMAGAEGIVAARDRGLLLANGGHIQIIKSWATSLLQRMGYVKRRAPMPAKYLNLTWMNYKRSSMLIFQQKL